MIRYPDRIAALEVVADHDAAYNAQSEALERVGHRVEVPNLRQAWMVLLQRQAKVRDMRKKLPKLLLGWQDDQRNRPWNDPAELAPLKIVKVWAVQKGRTHRWRLPFARTVGRLRR